MEDEKYYGDGVVTGHGLIHGRQVYLYLALKLKLAVCMIYGLVLHNSIFLSNMSQMSVLFRILQTDGFPLHILTESADF